jgi:MSHA biogenesis protein MshQ
VTVRTFARLLAFLGCLWLAAAPAQADTPLSVFQSFRGNVNFVGTQRTLRDKANTDPCSIATGKEVKADLKGIPDGAVVKSAQLYWAGSGTTGDYVVTLDGAEVKADAARSYLASAVANGTTYTFFSGAADVTTQVSQKRNGTYAFGGLKVNTGNPWCAVQGVVGGFSLAVVYSLPSEPFRMLNIYEGFQAFRNSSLTIQLGDFKIPDPLPASVTGRVGHVTWEGDETLSQGGEDLQFNGVALTDDMNPAGNQFNSASNVNGDKASYGIDFDVYTLAPPIIQGGQSSATSTYKTGADLVLLSSEIVAMPYVANADLALTMTRSGDLTVGSTATYTINVSNVGIDTELGPVKVVDTLSANLKLVSATGTGWTCTNAPGSNGQTIVTCTQPGPVAPKGGVMTPISIQVTPSVAGNYTNTATVSGATGDDNSANNTATDSGGATSSAVYGFMAVFTREACTNGQPIAFKESDSGCHVFTGPVVAADTNTNIYMTAVNNNNGVQTATALSGSDMSITLGVKASCLPSSGMTLFYAKTTFDCKGTWQNVALTVKGGQPSTQADIAKFVYNDVGQVTLSLRYESTVLANLTFISRPFGIRVYDAVRSDGYTQTDLAAAGSGFAASGDPFLVHIKAVMANGDMPRSFGKEAAALGGTMSNTDLKFGLDLFTQNIDFTPAVPLADKDGIVKAAFYVSQDWTPKSVTIGGIVYTIYELKASWYEAGYLALTPYLIDYLGTGQVGGPPANTALDSAARKVDKSTLVLGRFYPDHFTTKVTNYFDCPPSMKCPAAYDAAKPTYPLVGGIYSAQPFKFQVTPYSLPRADGIFGNKPQVLALFQNPAATSPRAMKMTGMANGNGTVAATGTLGLSAPFPYADTASAFPVLTDEKATFTLPNPYVTGQQPTAPATWSPPTPFYVRAEITENVRGASTTALKINSIAPAGTLYEDGLMAVAGRLQVQNAFGSELLRLPVPLAAQYWNSNAWLTNTAYADSTIVTGIAIDPKSCTRTLAQSPGVCRTNVVTVVGDGTPLAIDKGVGKLVLQAPGRPNVGSVDYTIPGTPAWLPSTKARATFGIYKSPVIYLREVY